MCGSASGPSRKARLLWYLDDIYLNAWPAVKTATITLPAFVSEGMPATFTASYTSIDTLLPVTYKWSFGGHEFVTTSPTTDLVFPDAGDVPVTLTVSNPYDSAVTTQTVTVQPNSDNFVLRTPVVPVAGGTVVRSPNQETFLPGTSVTLTAAPAAGYTFSGWSGGGCSGTAPCLLTMNADTTVTATFALIEYALNVSITGNGSVSKSPDQATYHYGDVVQLTATAGTGYAFSQWSGDLTGSANPASVTINGNKTITAAFIPGYSLSVTMVGNGSVFKYPDLETYLPGQVATLNAAPDTGWSFSAWSGACTGSGSCVVTMNENKSVIGTFTSNPYTLTTAVLTAGGSISKDPDQGTYTYGQIVTLTANPSTGYRLSAWSRDLTGSTSPITITMDGNKTVHASFTNSWPFTTAVSPAASGWITKTPNASSYVYGTVVTVTATPKTGWSFDHWGGSCTGTGACVVIVDGNEAVTAYFINQFTLNVTVIGSGAVTRSPDQANYTYGTIVTLTSIPTAGWSFSAWSGDLIGSTNPATITMIGHKAITATFTQDEYTLTVNAGTGGSVTKTPDQATYHLGDVVTLAATAEAGYLFTGWTGDHEGSISPVEVTITGSMTIAANFTLIPTTCFTLTLSHTGNGSNPVASPASSTGCTAGQYLAGELITLSGTVPETGWKISGWTGTANDSSILDTNALIMPISDHAAAVNYTQIEYTLTINQATGGTITATPAGPYHYGDVVIVEAVANTGYDFAGWTGDLSGTPNPNTITINGNKTVGATFELQLVTLTISQSTGGTITAAPAGPYHYGDVVNVEAAANTGYTFTGWMGDLSGTTNPTTITLNGNKTVGAIFEANVVTLIISPPTGGTITATPAGPYHYGDVVTVEATANPGYSFTGWTGGLSGTTNPTTITLNGDKTVGATFDLHWSP